MDLPACFTPRALREEVLAEDAEFSTELRRVLYFAQRTLRYLLHKLHKKYSNYTTRDHRHPGGNRLEAGDPGITTHSVTKPSHPTKGRREISCIQHHKFNTVLRFPGSSKINYKRHCEGGTTEAIFKQSRENKRSRRTDDKYQHSR